MQVALDGQWRSLVCCCSCEKSIQVMKSMISFNTTQDELADVAPLSYSYDELKTRRIKRAGRSCCEKLEFIFPITFHRKPSFLDLNSPHFSNTLFICSDQRWLTVSLQKPLLLSLFSFSSFTFTSFTSLSPTSLHSRKSTHTLLLHYSHNHVFHDYFALELHHSQLGLET